MYLKSQLFFVKKTEGSSNYFSKTC